MSRLRQAVVLGLAVLLATLSWQALNASILYQGQWSGFFWAGSRMPQPTDLPVVFQHERGGFDAQFYRVMAHQPLPRPEARPFFDDQRYRYGRPLIPWLAYLVGLGLDEWIDTAFIIVIDLGIVLSVVLLWWLTTPQVPLHHALIAGMLLPSTIAAADRLMPDVYLVVFVLAAFVAHTTARRRVAWLWLWCLLATFTKEYGVFLAAGLCLEALRRRRWKEMFVFASSQVPVILWQFYLFHATVTSVITRSSLRAIKVPILAQIIRLAKPRHPQGVDPWRLAWLQSTDFLSLILVTVVMAGIVVAAIRSRDDDRTMQFVMGSFSMFLLACAFFPDPYIFIRIAAVPIAWFAIKSLPVRPWLTIAALALLSSGMWYGTANFTLWQRYSLGTL